jgi:hypothetical protein
MNTPQSAKKTNSINSLNNSNNTINVKNIPILSSQNIINNSLGLNSANNINFYNFPHANINNSKILISNNNQNSAGPVLNN